MLDRQQHCGIPLGHQELRGGQIPEELRPRHQRFPDCGGGENEARQRREPGSGSARDKTQARGGGGRRGRRQQRGPGAECAERSDQVAVRGGAESGRGLVTSDDAVIQ